MRRRQRELGASDSHAARRPLCGTMCQTSDAPQPDDERHGTRPRRSAVKTPQAPRQNANSIAAASNAATARPAAVPAMSSRRNHDETTSTAPRADRIKTPCSASAERRRAAPSTTLTSAASRAAASVAAGRGLDARLEGDARRGASAGLGAPRKTLARRPAIKTPAAFDQPSISHADVDGVHGHARPLDDAAVQQRPLRADARGASRGGDHPQ